MKYILRQNLLTFKDTYAIKDERGNTKFLVKSKLISVGKKFWLCDARGTEIVHMKQALWHLMPHYKIEMGGVEVATAKSCFSLFKKKMKASSSNFGDIVIKGNVIGWTLKYTRDGVDIAKTSKSLMKIADTYTIDIAANEKDYYILALAVLSDAIFKPKK